MESGAATAPLGGSQAGTELDERKVLATRYFETSFSLQLVQWAADPPYSAVQSCTPRTLVKETGRIQYYCTSPCVAPVSEWVVALPMPAWAACAACRGGGGGRTSAASASSHWAASGGDRRPAAGHRGTRNLDGLVSQRPAQRSNLPSAGGGPVA